MRNPLAVTFVLCGVLLGAAWNMTDAHATSSSVSWDRQRVHVFRHDHDVKSMRYSAVLAQRAQHWAHRLAYGHIALADDQDPRPCWQLGGDFIGSNVGEGFYMGVPDLQHLMEGSKPHRSNMLEPRFKWFGVGVVHRKHKTFLVQDFCGVNP